MPLLQPVGKKDTRNRGCKPIGQGFTAATKMNPTEKVSVPEAQLMVSNVPKIFLNMIDTLINLAHSPQ